MPDPSEQLPSREVWIVFTRPRGGSPSQWDPKATGSLAHCRESIKARLVVGGAPFDAVIVGLQHNVFKLSVPDDLMPDPALTARFWHDWTMEDSPLVWRALEAAARHAIHSPINTPEE